MNNTKDRPPKYLDLSRHPEIQALKPDTENSEDVWLPTCEQLHALLTQKLPYPDRSVFQHTAAGWVYQTYFREWAADYGTYIETQRQFVGCDAKTVLLQVLSAALGIGERWMV